MKDKAAIAKIQYELWMGQKLEDADLTAELESIRSEEEAIFDCFYRELEFGTGGLRGVIGAGTNRLNVYTVAKASQGYANYLLGYRNETSAAGQVKEYEEQIQQKRSVAIAYDSRIKSELFAKTAAEVFAANGIAVYIYPELMPTPALSFAVRHLNCMGGIVITASHNPSKYNGYKVYGNDGGQITSQAAKEILQEIDQVDCFHSVKRISFEAGLQDGRICYISEAVVSAYMQAVSSQSLAAEGLDKSFSIVYTPLNGAGLHCVTRTLSENGFTNITIVEEQEQPDGNFPTCPYPNPEIRESMELGITYAKRMGSDLLLATDPDCDRVGIAVKAQGDYILLSGNEVGMLLLDYICKRRIALGKMPEKPVVVKTIVTIDMAQKIAADYGVEVINVLTGFKFIGEQIGILEAAGEIDRYIFGFEESYGYLTGGYVRDKDAVNGALMICEMFAYYKTRGQSLNEVLQGLYETYGYSLNTLHSYTFEGSKGFDEMQGIMNSFRGSLSGDMGGRDILSAEDYKKQRTSYADGREVPIYGLPKSDVLKVHLAGDLSFVVRPSGTEPKLKIYLSVQAKDMEGARQAEASLAQELEDFMKVSR